MNRERLNNLEMIYNIAVAQAKWPKQGAGAVKGGVVATRWGIVHKSNAMTRRCAAVERKKKK